MVSDSERRYVERESAARPRAAERERQRRNRPDSVELVLLP
jgi:hypothetical protein